MTQETSDYRGHAALKVAAELLHAFSILTLIGFCLMALAVSGTFQGIQVGPETVANLGRIGAAIIVVVGLVYSVVLWALADALILIADADDDHQTIIAWLERIDGSRRGRYG